MANDDVAHVIACNLSPEGLDVEIANSVQVLTAAISRGRFDVVIVDDDVAAPADAEEVLSRRPRDTALLWLCANPEQSTPRAAGLRKPVVLRELATAVHRVAWSRMQRASPERIVLGNVEIEPWALRVRCDGAPLPLTLTEFKLLTILASDPERVFSREELLQEVWGLDSGIQFETINQHIGRLRRSFRGSNVSIRSVRTAGYALEINRQAPPRAD